MIATTSARNPSFVWTPARMAAAAFGLGVLTSIAMIFVGWHAQHLVANGPDPYGFAAMAHSLLHGDGFANYGVVLRRKGPLYPATIALVYWITGEHPIAFKLVQALMLGGTCALTFDVGRRLFNTRTGLLAAVICAFDPMLIRYVADFHLETLLTFLSTLTLWRSLFFLERPTIKNGALFGVCAGLAALTKPVVLLYPGAFVGWWLLRGFRGRRAAAAVDRRTRGPWLAAAAVFVAMGAVILPWTARNYRASGHFVLVTTGTSDAFLRGYIFSKPEYALLRLPPYTYAENESNATFRAICRDAGAVWERDDIETERILRRAAKAKLLGDPLGFVRKFVVQIFTFWYEMTSLVNSIVAGTAAAVLWVFALFGWRRARAEGLDSWPLFAPILCLNLALAALLALGRYSTPILPELAVMAAFGADAWLARRSRKGKAAAAAPHPV